jgi:hypothetical protein
VWRDGEIGGSVDYSLKAFQVLNLNEG